MLKPSPSRIQLVVVQPTPFCNIDCRYCYLADRKSKKIIGEPTLSKIFERLFASAYLGDKVYLLWHAGEPLAVPIAFYERAAVLLAEYNVKHVEVVQQFQTNATLITQEWCDFFKEYNAEVGVSIDGPQRIHDANRITRSGKGTHERAMRGVRLLQDNGIPITNIAVLTDESLDHPDEIWDFFVGNGLTRLAFNIEEKEGAHKESSVAQSDCVARYQSFLRRLRDLRRASGLNVVIRELDSMEKRVLFASGEPHSALNRPMATLSFDCEGNFSTFSPELLTVEHPKYGHFRFGNVFDCAIDEILERERFLAVFADLHRGVERCRATCPYFSLCGGGQPSNKLAENGTLDSTETMQCRLIIQGLCDLVMDDVEQTLGVVGRSEPDEHAESFGRPEKQPSTVDLLSCS